MTDFLDILGRLSGLAPEQWVGLIAVSALALAAFALFVVHSVIKGGRQP